MDDLEGNVNCAKRSNWK